jgi:hypothetical protein
MTERLCLVGTKKSIRTRFFGQPPADSRDATRHNTGRPTMRPSLSPTLLQLSCKVGSVELSRKVESEQGRLH